MIEFLQGLQLPFLIFGTIGIVLAFLITMSFIRLVVGLIIPHRILRHSLFWRQPYSVGKAIKIKWGHPNSHVKMPWNSVFYEEIPNIVMRMHTGKIIGIHDDFVKELSATDIGEFVRRRSLGRADYFARMLQLYIMRSIEIHEGSVGIGWEAIMYLGPRKKIQICLGHGQSEAPSVAISIEELRELYDTLEARTASYE